MSIVDRIEVLETAVTNLLDTFLEIKEKALATEIALKTVNSMISDILGDKYITIIETKMQLFDVGVSDETDSMKRIVDQLREILDVTQYSSFKR